MYYLSASAIPMDLRLPRLRAYLTQARRTVADPRTDDRTRHRTLRRIARIEADLARAADGVE